MASETDKGNSGSGNSEKLNHIYQLFMSAAVSLVLVAATGIYKSMNNQRDAISEQAQSIARMEEQINSITMVLARSEKLERDIQEHSVRIEINAGEIRSLNGRVDRLEQR